HASGAVSAVNAGGLIGRNDGSATVAKVYATGTVSGASSVGGLVGLNQGALSDSYATGAVSGTTNLGGMVGQNDGGTLGDSFWDLLTTGLADACGSNVNGGVCTATGLGTDQMKDPFTFIDLG